MGCKVALFEGDAKVIGFTLVIDAPNLDTAKQWISDFDNLVSFAQSYPQVEYLEITIEKKSFLPKMRLRTCPQKQVEHVEYIEHKENGLQAT
jgi:hypothetical protein